jgi:hypothetical protein
MFSAAKSNALPFGVAFDPESRTSTIYSRTYSPLVTLPGKFPRVDYSLAVPCDPDAPKLYGCKPIYHFYRPDHPSAPFADPVVRRRLRSLVAGCEALRAELRRRGALPEPKQTASHADLVAKTFSWVPA